LSAVLKNEKKIPIVLDNFEGISGNFREQFGSITEVHVSGLQEVWFPCRSGKVSAQVFN
jgi:hypothetical protein